MSALLGHGDTLDSQVPKTVQVLNNVGPVVQISDGAFYVLAVTEDRPVYSFGDDSDLCLGHGDFKHNRAGCLGHGDQRYKSIPKVLISLTNHLAVQVCAGWMKTFVVSEAGLVYGFGLLNFGTLGFQGGRNEEVDQPRVIECLRSHHVLQVCDGMSHSLVVTQKGKLLQLLGLGDNTGFLLGLQTYLDATEIVPNS
ncbi:Regulator of chromosome condensation (RCC1) family protein [Raphanus sativus]|nr:Regulator of chromosome condensation (RCC1) family protein [Raphanus sativus]